MAGRTSRERAEREARKRLRAFTARQSVHARQVARRRRDNIAAVIAIVVVAVLATVAQLGYFSIGPGERAQPKVSASAAPSPTASAVPNAALAENRTWTGTLTINGVKLGISLDGKKAPQAVADFISLTDKGFYTGAYCPRLTTKTVYILQCGSPTNSTSGGPGYSFGPIENAPKDGVYTTGVLAMARSQNDASSQGSQFFLVYGAPSTFPDDSAGGYSVFGRVTSGLAALKSTVIDKGLVASAASVGDGAPKSPVKITSVTVK